MASIETASKIRCISNALVLIGELPLSDISEDRYDGTAAANLFEVIYENELQSNRWRFSVTKKALSRLVAAPLNQWQYAYQLPADMLLPIGMYPPQPYEIYGQHLYTNASAVELEYQFKCDVSRCPAYFSLLVSYAIAKNVAKPVTESENAKVNATNDYDSQRKRALFADAQGRPSQTIMHSPFTDNR